MKSQRSHREEVYYLKAAGSWDSGTTRHHTDKYTTTMQLPTRSKDNRKVEIMINAKKHLNSNAM